jgi:prepilin-type processing-associated H-X9-DG protein
MNAMKIEPCKHAHIAACAQAGSRGVRRVSGMSLAEVLILIAVVGLLTAVAVPMLLKAKLNSQLERCGGNLKQIGTAMRLYALENNDWLPPGPSLVNGEPMGLSSLQAPVYGRDGSFKKWLPYHLAPHLGLPTAAEVGNGTNVAGVFICPSYVASLPANSRSGDYTPASDNFTHAFSYALTRSTSTAGDRQQLPSRPFGERGVSGPLKLMDIQAVAPLGDVYALLDFDSTGVANVESLGGDSLPFTAKLPVHDTVRNVLYFDGHVEAVEVAAMRNY